MANYYDPFGGVTLVIPLTLSPRTTFDEQIDCSGFFVSLLQYPIGSVLGPCLEVAFQGQGREAAE